MIPYSETAYGFVFGSATVHRITSDEKRGWVVIGIDSRKHKLEVYVTKTGKMRLHLDGKEVGR